MSQTVTISDALYARLEKTARQHGFQTVEQLIESWQATEDELRLRRLAVQRIDTVREHGADVYGLQPDSTGLLREDRAR
jgi:hypothetical protein